MLNIKKIIETEEKENVMLSGSLSTETGKVPSIKRKQGNLTSCNILLIQQLPGVFIVSKPALHIIV